MLRPQGSNDVEVKLFGLSLLVSQSCLIAPGFSLVRNWPHILKNLQRT